MRYLNSVDLVFPHPCYVPLAFCVSPRPTGAGKSGWLYRPFLSCVFGRVSLDFPFSLGSCSVGFLVVCGASSAILRQASTAKWQEKCILEAWKRRAGLWQRANGGRQAGLRHTTTSLARHEHKHEQEYE